MRAVKQPRWYVQSKTAHGKIILRGGYASSEIRQALKLGRISADAPVCLFDAEYWKPESWEPLSQVPELVPESMLSGGYEFEVD